MTARIHPFCIIGHRGAPILIPPGNTIVSLSKAIDVGAKMLMIDVRRTRDDILVLDHESAHLIAGQETALAALSYSQWKRYFEQNETPLATLDEALELAEERGVKLIVDFREPGTETLLARAIRNSGFPLERLVVSGANDYSRRILRGLDPNINLSHSLEFEDAPVIDAKFLAELDVDVVTWHYRLLTPAIVNVLHLRKITVYAETIDLTDGVRRVRDMGVDGVITYTPELFKSLV